VSNFGIVLTMVVMVFALAIGATIVFCYSLIVIDFVKYFIGSQWSHRWVYVGLLLTALSVAGGVLWSFGLFPLLLISGFLVAPPVRLAMLVRSKKLDMRYAVLLGITTFLTWSHAILFLCALANFHPD
jgi:hypothetical protein